MSRPGRPFAGRIAKGEVRNVPSVASGLEAGAADAPVSRDIRPIGRGVRTRLWNRQLSAPSVATHLARTPAPAVVLAGVASSSRTAGRETCRPCQSRSSDAPVAPESPPQAAGENRAGLGRRPNRRAASSGTFARVASGPVQSSGFVGRCLLARQISSRWRRPSVDTASFGRTSGSSTRRVAGLTTVRPRGGGLAFACATRPVVVALASFSKKSRLTPVTALKCTRAARCRTTRRFAAVAPPP